ncbi:MAG: hypothetical protein K5694_02760 [Bacilli bacterium]|nr:hypothetical protein [Bacilli bacterium]
MKKHLKIFAPIALTLALGILPACGQSSAPASDKLVFKNVEIKFASSTAAPVTVSQVTIGYKESEPDIVYVAPENFIDPTVVPFSRSEQNGVFTYKSSSYEISFDVNSDKIEVTNYEGLLNPVSPNKTRISLSPDFISFDANASRSDKTGQKTVFDFAKYGFDIFPVEANGEKYPFAPLTALAATMTAGQVAFGYNGSFIFAGSPDNLYADGKLTPAGEAFYGGAYQTKSSYSEGFAKYNYNVLTFLFDNFCGLSVEKGISDYKSYLKDKGFEAGLLSTNANTVSDAISQFIYKGMDEDHNSFRFGNFSCKGKFFAPDGKTVPAKYYVGERRAKMIASDKALLEYKNATLKKLGAQYFPVYQSKDDTAMIYIPNFAASALNNKAPGSTDASSTYAILYNSFQRIQADAAIKNVIINLADNPGGAADALVQSLGFISNGGVAHVTDRIYKTDTYSEEYYKVDTNADGVFDSKDGFGGKYNFYIVETYSSFSCGNALPYYAKKDGLAKIVGQTSGGGNCVVGNVFLPTGDIIGYACNTILGKKENGVFTSNDAGVTPDIAMTDLSGIFDLDTLITAIKA